jgi:hypothetical protein
VFGRVIGSPPNLRRPLPETEIQYRGKWYIVYLKCVSSDAAIYTD